MPVARVESLIGWIKLQVTSEVAPKDLYGTREEEEKLPINKNVDARHIRKWPGLPLIDKVKAKPAQRRTWLLMATTKAAAATAAAAPFSHLSSPRILLLPSVSSGCLPVMETAATDAQIDCRPWPGWNYVTRSAKICWRPAPRQINRSPSKLDCGAPLLPPSQWHSSASSLSKGGGGNWPIELSLHVYITSIHPLSVINWLLLLLWLADICTTAC